MLIQLKDLLPGDIFKGLEWDSGLYTYDGGVPVVTGDLELPLFVKDIGPLTGGVYCVRYDPEEWVSLLAGPGMETENIGWCVFVNGRHYTYQNAQSSSRR